MEYAWSCGNTWLRRPRFTMHETGRLQFEFAEAFTVTMSRDDAVAADSRT
jgi:hypothetical protein